MRADSGTDAPVARENGGVGKFGAKHALGDSSALGGVAVSDDKSAILLGGDSGDLGGHGAEEFFFITIEP